MKFSRYSTFACWALAGWMLSDPTAAMTLGRLRGAAVLGQPLAVTVPVQTADGEDVGGLCVGADVYFGDAPVEASHVTARLDGVAGAATVRLSVRKSVDEPIVTLYLRTGCLQQSTRKYVLLSEFPSEVQSQQLAIAGKEDARALPAVTVAAVPSLQSVPLQALPSTSARRTVRTRPAADAVATAKAPSAMAVPSSNLEKNATTLVSPKTPSLRKKMAAAGSRLQLLPLELTQDWEPSLRFSDQLPVLSGEVDAQKRAQAAELWHVINATPEEILQAAGKRAAMEAELNSLVASSRANQAAIMELNAQLKAAHEGRIWNPAVYVLLVLLAACGAGLVYVVFNRPALARAGAPWWLGASDASEAAVAASREGQNVDSLRTTAPQTAADAVKSPLQEPTAIDIPLSDSVLPTLSRAELRGSHSAAAVHTPSGYSKSSDFTHSNLGVLRAINSQEMVDARQQADFFVALGQHDEAVEVLHGALSQGAESNPHIYLDLIALLHKLSRKEDYEKVRQVFNALYTCHLPAYGEYSAVGRSLVDYPDLLNPLVSLWPKPVAIEYLVRCLVRDDADSLNSGIDRDAFEDLLLLHGVLGSVAQPSLPSDALQPCPDRTLAPLTAQPQPFLNPQNLSASGVDLDLSVGH